MTTFARPREKPAARRCHRESANAPFAPAQQSKGVSPLRCLHSFPIPSLQDLIKRRRTSSTDDAHTMPLRTSTSTRPPTACGEASQRFTNTQAFSSVPTTRRSRLVAATRRTSVSSERGACCGKTGEATTWNGPALRRLLLRDPVLSGTFLAAAAGGETWTPATAFTREIAGAERMRRKRVKEQRLLDKLPIAARRRAQAVRVTRFKLGACV